MPTRQFRPVVTANRQRLPALGHDPIQHSRHSSTGKTGVHLQGEWAEDPGAERDGCVHTGVFGRAGRMIATIGVRSTPSGGTTRP